MGFKKLTRSEIWRIVEEEQDQMQEGVLGGSVVWVKERVVLGPRSRDDKEKGKKKSLGNEMDLETD